jgi:hypothetical protein
MRKWGIVISISYALILLCLILPGFIFLSGLFHDSGSWRRALSEALQTPIVLLPLGIFFFGEVLLLFLSVDTSFRHLKPRAHILVSCTVTAILMALLTAAGVWSLGFGLAGENWGKTYFPTDGIVWGFCGGLWVFWGILFYAYFRNSSTAVNRLVSWLLKGSVLELLIAVPCHVIVRRRNDCSAPMVTSFGIATGIAIMLLSFGPSVLFLYKRLDSYPSSPS